MASSVRWSVAAIRCRGGRKCGEIRLNTARNRCAELTVRKPFIARSRWRVGWWEFSHRLFKYLFCRCSVVDIIVRWATRYEASLSVISTRGGRACRFRSFLKNLVAALPSRFPWIRMSSTFPCWSTARHKYFCMPPILMNTSSRCHLSPGRGTFRRSRRAYSGPNLAPGADRLVRHLDPALGHQ